MIHSRLSVASLLSVLLATGPTFAQTPTNAELRKELQTLKESVEAMRQDLQEIKALLQRGAPSPQRQNFVLDIGSRPFKGLATAKVTLVEFSDFQCPFCERHFRQTYPQIVKEYVDTGKLKIVFMHLPLESLHKLAFKAAEVAHCAGEQEKFFEMHDRLFATQKRPGEFSDWKGHAQALGLNVIEFETCLNSERPSGEIRKDLSQARAAGISGTPGFLVGRTDPSTTKVETSRFINGAQPYAAFKNHIEALLAER